MLITETSPDYQYVASALVNYDLRKTVYGNFQPPHLLDHYLNVLRHGMYDGELKDKYNYEEWCELNNAIDHNRDFSIAYIGMEEFREKYLLKNRSTGSFFETPQMAYMLIAMTLFSNYPKETRMKYVIDYYDAISKFYISLPTSYRDWETDRKSTRLNSSH